MRRRHFGRGALIGAALSVVAATGVIASPASATSTSVLRIQVLGPDAEPMREAEVIIARVMTELNSDRYLEDVIAQAQSDANGLVEIDLMELPKVEDYLQLPGPSNHGVLNMILTATNTVVAEVGTIDPPKTVETAQATYFTAFDLAYAQVEVHNADGAVNYALSAPDLVTLEMTAVGTVDTVAGSGAETDQTCNLDYAPWVEVIGREVPLEPVGELHTYWDMNAYFEYGHEANTDLGGAWRASGGGWKVSAGANHMGNKSSTVGQYTGPYTGRVALTQFRYRHEKVYWTDNRGQECRTEYRIVPERWHGGGMALGRDTSSGDGRVMFTGGAYDKGFYYQFGPNTWWRKNTGGGKKFTADVQAFGITLHGKSNWGWRVDIQYRFGRESVEPHYLFAPDAQPDKAKIVYAY